MAHEYLHPFCRARIVPMLSQISSAIADNKELPEVMDLVVKTMVEHLAGTERVILTILDRTRGSISIESAYGLSEEEQSRGVYHVGEGITGKVAQTGVAAIVPDLHAEPTFLNRTMVISKEHSPQLAFICVPVKSGHEVLGTLSAYRPKVRSDHDFSMQQDAEVMTIIATMIAQVVELQAAYKEETGLLLQENRRLSEALASRYHPSQIIGNSRSMLDLFRMLNRVYDKVTPVLILGETGAGKELVAQALHYNGPRAKKAFIKFNCAALPESLAESELFGHEKGAFTGALSQRKGRFEEADGGTLFLDEVGELSLSVQAKLLRVLQASEFERVGGSQTVRVDVRFITATNRDLLAMIAAGTFREDLYYRLNVFPLMLPPLRERGSDILLLADYFVEKYAKLHNSPVRRISSPAIELLMAWNWPGNVRELENVIERAVILSDDGVIHSYHLPPSLQSAESSGTQWHGSLDQKLDMVERETIIEAIKMSGGNMARSARELGLTERVMALRMRKYAIDYRKYRGSSL